MEKLEGVQSAKVSLNEGRAVVELEPGNTVTLAQIHERVRRNGFTPQGAVVTVRARVAGSGDKLRLEVAGTQESFDVAVIPQGLSLVELKKRVGQIVVVDGVVPAPKGETLTVIEVRAVKAERVEGRQKIRLRAVRLIGEGAWLLLARSSTLRARSSVTADHRRP